MDRRLAWLSVIVVSLSASSVSAQSRPFEQGLRIGLATDLLAHGEQTFSTVRFASTVSATSTTTSYGIVVPRLGLDLGGFPIPFVGAGVALSIGQRETSSGSGSSRSESDVLEYLVVPYVEGRIPVIDALAVQLRLDAGVVGSEETSRAVTSSGLPSAQTLSLVQFAIGGRAGVHAYLADSFSISPYVGFRYTIGEAIQSESFPTTAAEVSVQSWEISLGLALYGWIDLTGDREAVEPTPTP